MVATMTTATIVTQHFHFPNSLRQREGCDFSLGISCLEEVSLAPSPCSQESDQHWGRRVPGSQHGGRLGHHKVREEGQLGARGQRG
jgi:hypothetical protein